MKAYIIGNGTSRKDFDLNKLKHKGTIYGCNALYRDFMPDVLVVNDPAMTREVFDSGYSGNLWCRRIPPGYEHKQVYDVKHPGQMWATGPTAVWMAAQEHSELYMLGFDFIGLNTGKHGALGSINNIYTNTENYRGSNRPAPDHQTWIQNILTITADYPEKKFTFVGTCELEEFKIYNNIITIDYKAFIKLINNDNHQWVEF